MSDPGPGRLGRAVLGHLAAVREASCGDLAEHHQRDWCVMNECLHVLGKRGLVRKVGQHKAVRWTLSEGTR